MNRFLTIGSRQMARAAITSFNAQLAKQGVTAQYKKTPVKCSDTGYWFAVANVYTDNLGTLSLNR